MCVCVCGGVEVLASFIYFIPLIFSCLCHLKPIFHHVAQSQFKRSMSVSALQLACPALIIIAAVIRRQSAGSCTERRIFCTVRGRSCRCINHECQIGSTSRDLFCSQNGKRLLVPIEHFLLSCCKRTKVFIRSVSAVRK